MLWLVILLGCNSSTDCKDGFELNEDGYCYEESSSSEIEAETGSEPSSDSGELDSSEEPLLPGPGAASVEGEVSAGHGFPLWKWSFPEAVLEVRFRINAGEWVETTGQQGTHTADTELSVGGHNFEIQGRNEGTEWSEITSFETTVRYFESNTGYWSMAERAFTKSPLGHHMGIVCHNCYRTDSWDQATNLQETAQALQSAIDAGADLLELDIKVEEGVWYVEHDDIGGTHGAFLSDVLLLANLQDGDQPLFIEIKERNPTEGQIAQLIEQLVTSGYAVNGRPVVLRTFQTRLNNFDYAMMVLEDYPFHKPYFRFHVIFNADERDNIEDFQFLLTEAKNAGYHGVEFSRRTPNLFSLLHKAQSLGLATAMWTVPELMGEIYCAGFREKLDALITDYPIADCKTVAQEDTNILYLDVSQTPTTATSIEYLYNGNQVGSHSIDSIDTPTLGSSTDGVLSGSYLRFDSASQQSMLFHDGDNESDQGYFLMMVVQMDILGGTGWDVQALASKADSGGFALELENSWGNNLRYGVRVDDGYEYATLDTFHLSTDQLHYIIGTYDGNGRVRLWVDGSDSWVSTSGVLSSGVVQNNSPIRIGADPEGQSGARYFFDGKVQSMSLLKWRDHQN